MIDNRDLLKKAFIDSQLECSVNYTHTFSSAFNEKMQRIIKYQKGFRKLINTASKRVAVFFLAILICVTSVACSIKEVREPIIEEIKKFVVNAKEILSGTAANDVSYLFPSDITKIVGTSYISEDKNQYVIEDKEKVTAFVKLLSETYWGEPEQFEEFESTSTYWVFDFFDEKEEIVFQIKMCNDVNYLRSKIAIIKDGEEKRFYISNKVYKDILAFTNEKYYLHNSPIKEIDTSFFEKKNSKCLYGMTDDEAGEVKKRIRNLHYEMEYFLMSNVSLLKENDSIYWEYVIDETIFTDPISKTERKYDMKRIFENDMNYIISVVEDKDTKENLSKALMIFKESLTEHNLSGLFLAHEYIHDYDYFAFNFPTHYVYSEHADYQGINDYFGKLG